MLSITVFLSARTFARGSKYDSGEEGECQSFYGKASLEISRENLFSPIHVISERSRHAGV